MKSRTLTVAIVIGMVSGILAGAAARAAIPDPATLKGFAATIGLLADIFLRLIRMVIAPLVFSTLVAGIAGMQDMRAVGRIGGKTMAWFVLVSSLSITLGMVLVSWLGPGVGTGLVLPDAATASGVSTEGLTLAGFVAHLVPKSIVEAMANNEILQIVVFSVFFGTAALAVGERAKPLVALVATLSRVMLELTGYVMNFAPVAVFAALASVVAKQGLGALAAYGTLVGEFYFGIALLWAILIGGAYLALGRRAFRLVARLREPLLLAFGTASSEAAYPKTLEQLERFGCSGKVASFVLPLGYSFNLDGSMMYCAFAAMFLAQVYQVPMDFGRAVAIALTMMVTTKGIAGVPRAGLVVVAAMLPMIGVPESGLILLIGIDQVFDMARTATNILGNGVAAAVVSRWENQLGEERPDALAAADIMIESPA
jgi:Na+/H+-dicarboxylate symporter